MNVFRPILSDLFSIAKAILPNLLPDVGAEGSVGRGYFTSNIRIVYVNGILTQQPGCERNARHVSNVFLGTTVDYAYVPTSVFQTWSAVVFGAVPDGSEKLLSIVRKNLSDLSLQENPANTLIVIAHSGGAATFKAMAKNLTAEEKRMIHIVTLGSAHIFTQVDGFPRYTNIVSEDDLVPTISSIATGRLLTAQASPHVCSLAQKQRLGPIQSHFLSGESYTEALHAVKEAYAMEHGGGRIVPLYPEEKQTAPLGTKTFLEKISSVFDFFRSQFFLFGPLCKRDFL